MRPRTCIEDLRQMHRRRVPRMFYDYVDSGSWSEATYHANEDDFARLKFRQKVAVDVSGRSTQMPMLGQMLPMPVALAPTGFAGMQYADGEILAAKGRRILVCHSRFPLWRFVRLRMSPKPPIRRSGFSFTSCATAILSNASSPVPKRQNVRH